MKKEEIKFLGLIFSIIFLGSVFIIFHTSREKSPPELCRQIFLGMVGGNQSVEKFIDWDKLNALGIDVSAIYPLLPNEKEKQDYRREFFRNLSFGFKQSGGKPKDFINWRIYGREGEKTVVAADYSAKGKTILFTLSGEGQNKLILIKWEGENG